MLCLELFIIYSLIYFLNKWKWKQDAWFESIRGLTLRVLRVLQGHMFSWGLAENKAQATGWIF